MTVVIYRVRLHWPQASPTKLDQTREACQGQTLQLIRNMFKTLASGLTHKHKTRVERPAWDKHSSLLGTRLKHWPQALPTNIRLQLERPARGKHASLLGTFFLAHKTRLERPARDKHSSLLGTCLKHWPQAISTINRLEQKGLPGANTLAYQEHFFKIGPQDKTRKACQGQTRQLIRNTFKTLASGLTHKHYTRVERPARGKHASLLGTLVNYGRKKFYNILRRI